MGLSTKRIKKHGKTFPTRDHKKTLSAGSPIENPNGIAPRSSVTGSIEEKNTMYSGGMFKTFIL